MTSGDNGAELKRLLEIAPRPGYADDEIDAQEGWRKLKAAEAEADRLNEQDQANWFGGEPSDYVESQEQTLEKLRIAMGATSGLKLGSK